ncbi:MAG: type II secretion system protein J [Chthoniobacteraceae bacterium]
MPLFMRRLVEGAFSLVELMVSVSVLTLIVMMVSQLVNSATVTTINSTKLIDTDSQARLIFSRMAEDFAAMFNRPDLNYYFHSRSGGNDELYFFSQVTGYVAEQDPAGTSDSSINTASLVGYRVNDTVAGSNRAELERLGRGLHWADIASQNETSGAATSIVHLPLLIRDAFSKALADPYNNSSNPNPSLSKTAAPEWDVIGDQVFRMAFCFLLKDGTFSLTPVSGTGVTIESRSPGSADDVSTGLSVDSRWYDSSAQVAYRCVNAATGAAQWRPLGLQDVKAVVVTIALLDSKSRVTTNLNAIKNAVSYLPDFATSGTVPVSAAWVQKTNDAKTLAGNTGLSPSAASSVHVYERFFYLN